MSAHRLLPGLLAMIFSCNSGGAPTGGDTVHATVDLQSTLITASPAGEAVACEAGGAPTLLCCDIWNNAGGDYVGCIAGQFGNNGNISEDPVFCDIMFREYNLHPDSPCAPFTAPNPTWTAANVMRPATVATNPVTMPKNGTMDRTLAAMKSAMRPTSPPTIASSGFDFRIQ